MSLSIDGQARYESEKESLLLSFPESYRKAAWAAAEQMSRALGSPILNCLGHLVVVKLTLPKDPEPEGAED